MTTNTMKKLISGTLLLGVSLSAFAFKGSTPKPTLVWAPMERTIVSPWTNDTITISLDYIDPIKAIYVVKGTRMDPDNKLCPEFCVYHNNEQ